MRARAHKYGAKPTVVDNIRFASKKEAARYCELKLLTTARQVSHLTLQDRWPLMVPYGVDKHVIGHYLSDFRYYDEQKEEWVTEDVKGFRTPLYRWKKRHVEAQYGITIRET